MRYSKEGLLEIGKDVVLEDKTGVNRAYDWIDIVGIPQRPKHLKSPLFFATHSKGEGGWDNGFDRRPYAAQVAKSQNASLVVDESFQDVSDLEYIRVNSLDRLASKLYDDARLKSRPFIVGVTGSVGKTTTVAFLEHLLRFDAKEVLRFYSKRLTPLSVMCHYINRVDEKTDFITLEYSAYLKEHVPALSNLLPPDISFLSNIYDAHINPGMFSSKKDIFDSKIQIKPTSGIGLISDKILSDLNLPLPDGWRSFNIETPDLMNPYCPPTLRTSEMYSIGKLISEEIGISNSIFRQAFETFVPKEDRIIVCNYFGKKIFFHGETSGGSRLWSWFETTDGTLPWFLVEEINFADEDPEGFKELLDKVFSSDKTFVLDTPTNRERLSVNANFLKVDEFRDIFSKKASGYIVYHKALSVRDENFNPQKYLTNKWS